MAEAHNAVAFQFVVTDDGVQVNLNKEIVRLMANSAYKSVKRRANSAKNTFLIGVYPASPATWMFFLAALLSARYSEHEGTLDILDRMEHRFPQKHRFDRSTVLAICIFTMVTLVWLFSAYFCQFLLRKLLTRWDILYAVRNKKVSLYDKLWLCAIKMLSGLNHPGLFSFQNCLPKLHVPSLDDTLKRHLDTVKPFMSDEEYQTVVEQTKEFKEGIGSKLQRYLVLKSLWSPNYVSDWWERFVYLRSRGSLMINSNYYGVGSLYAPLTNIQSARAANLIYAFFRYRKQIDKHRMIPMRLAGCYPLCSNQYTRQFNSSRLPGKEEDVIAVASDIHHVVVYHKGRFFKVNAYFSGDLLKPADLQAKIIKIIENTDEADASEVFLPVLTAMDRTTWAEARTKHFSSGVNKASLDIVEKAAFFVVLEDSSDHWCYNDTTQEKLNAFSKRMLHGQGYDRWFDKSFNLIICKNGQIGFNAEHTWADAPVMAQVWEWVIVEDIEKLKYDASGNCCGSARYEWPLPKRLEWDLNPEVVQIINDTLPKARAQIDDVDLFTLIHTRFGKGDIKKLGVSPDAFIQIAFQLAYYKHTGKVCLTYEAAMTRLFRDGRTETVRSCSIDSTNFVKIACDPDATLEEKKLAMKKATDSHIYSCRKAMTGEGIDRHLFSLYVVSKYLQLEVPLLQTYLSEKWLLSTSQTAVNQTMRLNLDKYPDRACAGGGFGPVDANGYGISYIICGETLMSFHVSCKKACGTTNSETFANLIAESLWQMRGYFLDDEGKKR